MSKRHQNSLFVSLDDLVSNDHPYRRLEELISFERLSPPYASIDSAKGRQEKGVEYANHHLEEPPSYP